MTPKTRSHSYDSRVTLRIWDVILGKPHSLPLRSAPKRGGVGSVKVSVDKRHSDREVDFCSYYDEQNGEYFITFDISSAHQNRVLSRHDIFHYRQNYTGEKLL